MARFFLCRFVSVSPKVKRAVVLPLLRSRMVEDAVKWAYSCREDCAHTVVAMGGCRGWTEATSRRRRKRSIRRVDMFDKKPNREGNSSNSWNQIDCARSFHIHAEGKALPRSWAQSRRGQDVCQGRHGHWGWASLFRQRR